MILLPGRFIYLSVDKRVLMLLTIDIPIFSCKKPYSALQGCGLRGPAPSATGCEIDGIDDAN